MSYELLFVPRQDARMNYSYALRVVVLSVPQQDALMYCSYISRLLFDCRKADTIINYSYISRVLFVCFLARHPNEL